MAGFTEREIEVGDTVLCRFEERGNVQFVGVRIHRLNLGGDTVLDRFEERGDHEFVGGGVCRVDLGGDNVVLDEAAVVLECVFGQAARCQSHSERHQDGRES